MHAYAHVAKTLFFFKKIDQYLLLCVMSEGGLQCNASVSGLSLLGGLNWLSIKQSLCVLQSSVNACGLPKDSASALISASSSSAEASESRSKHDWMHRVGSQRRLELATTCSDPPTNAQCKCNARALSYTNFVAIVWAGQLVVMVACGGRGLLLILSCTLWIQKWKSYSSVAMLPQIILYALPVTMQYRQRCYTHSSI